VTSSVFDVPPIDGIPSTPISVESVGSGGTVGIGDSVGVESVGVGSEDVESVGTESMDTAFESVGTESMDTAFESVGTESMDTESLGVGVESLDVESVDTESDFDVSSGFGVSVGELSVGVDVSADFDVSDVDLSVVPEVSVASGVSLAFELEPVELAVLSVSFDVGVGDSSLELVVGSFCSVVVSTSTLAATLTLTSSCLG